MIKAALLVVLTMISGCKKKGEAPATVAKDAAAATATDAPAAVAPDAAEPAPADAAAVTPDAVATLDEDARDEVCSRVHDRLNACFKDPEFLAALTAGLSASDKKQQEKFAKGVKDWPAGFCTLWEYDWEENGFRDHLELLAAPEAVETCAALGTSIKAAGGMLGGSMVK